MLTIVIRKPVSPAAAEIRAHRIARVRGLFERRCECSSGCITDDEVAMIYARCIDYADAFDVMVEEMAALFDEKRCDALDTRH